MYILYVHKGSRWFELLRFNSALFNSSVSIYPFQLWYDPISHDPTWHDPTSHDPTRMVRFLLYENLKNLKFSELVK